MNGELDGGAPETESTGGSNQAIRIPLCPEIDGVHPEGCPSLPTPPPATPVVPGRLQPRKHRQRLLGFLRVIRAPPPLPHFAGTTTEFNVEKFAPAGYP